MAKRKATGRSHLATAPPGASPRPLFAPKEMPKRRAFGSPGGRVALLHALAHIELNAIDLGWDILAQFSGERLPREFFDDWVGVASEEAVHFDMLARRLADFGARYGDLPAHDGSGKRPWRQPAICSQGWLSCRWRSRRAGSM